MPEIYDSGLGLKVTYRVAECSHGHKRDMYLTEIWINYISLLKNKNIWYIRAVPLALRFSQISSTCTVDKYVETHPNRGSVS